MTQFFEVFYRTEHATKEMAYPVQEANGQTSSSETVFGWLSNNTLNPAVNNDNASRLKNSQFPKLWQSFMDAGRAFKAIDAPTKAVIVPYTDEGSDLITALYGTQFNGRQFTETFLVRLHDKHLSFNRAALFVHHFTMTVTTSRGLCNTI